MKKVPLPNCSTETSLQNICKTLKAQSLLSLRKNTCNLNKILLQFTDRVHHVNQYFPTWEEHNDLHNTGPPKQSTTEPKQKPGQCRHAPTEQEAGAVQNHLVY